MLQVPNAYQPAELLRFDISALSPEQHRRATANGRDGLASVGGRHVRSVDGQEGSWRPVRWYRSIAFQMRQPQQGALGVWDSRLWSDYGTDMRELARRSMRSRTNVEGRMPLNKDLGPVGRFTMAVKPEVMANRHAAGADLTFVDAVCRDDEKAWFHPPSPLSQSNPITAFFCGSRCRRRS